MLGWQGMQVNVDSMQCVTTTTANVHLDISPLVVLQMTAEVLMVRKLYNCSVHLAFLKLTTLRIEACIYVSFQKVGSVGYQYMFLWSLDGQIL